MMDRNEQDELLSAYVDGELTDAERMAVEQRLRSDPAARRTLDGLRQAAAAMQSLPRGRAPAELAEAVRARLERRALLEPAAAIPRRGWNVRFFAMAAAVALTAGLAFFMSPAQTARHAEVAMTRSQAARSSDASVESSAESLSAREPADSDIALDAEAKRKLAEMGYMEDDVVADSRSRRDAMQEADTKPIDVVTLGGLAQAARPTAMGRTPDSGKEEVSAPDSKDNRQQLTSGIKDESVLVASLPQAAQDGIGTAEWLYRVAEPFKKADGEREMTASEAAVEIAALNARLEGERGVAPIPATAAEAPLDKNEILRKAFSITTTTISAAAPQPVDVSSEPKLRAGPVMIVTAPSDMSVNRLDRAFQSAVAAAQQDVPQVRLVITQRQLRDEPQPGTVVPGAADTPLSDARITNEFQVEVPRMQLSAVARRISDEARAQQVRVSLESDSAARWSDVASAIAAAQSVAPSATPLRVAALGDHSAGRAAGEASGSKDRADRLGVRVNRPATAAPAREPVVGGEPPPIRPRLGVADGDAESAATAEGDGATQEPAQTRSDHRPARHQPQRSRTINAQPPANPRQPPTSAPLSLEGGASATGPSASSPAGGGDELILMTIRILAPAAASRESPRE